MPLASGQASRSRRVKLSPVRQHVPVVAGDKHATLVDINYTCSVEIENTSIRDIENAVYPVGGFQFNGDHFENIVGETLADERTILLYARVFRGEFAMPGGIDCIGRGLFIIQKNLKRNEVRILLDCLVSTSTL